MDHDWKSIVEQKSVPEIWKIRDDVIIKSKHKDEELKDYIGREYSTLLNAADRIVRVSANASEQRDLYVRLCLDPTREFVRSVFDPSKPQDRRRLEERACSSITRRCESILFSQLHVDSPPDLLLCARLLYLVSLIHNSRDPHSHLHQAFQQTLQKQILGHSAFVPLFLSQLTLQPISIEQVCDAYLDAHYKAISRCLTTSKSLVEALDLYTRTLQVVNLAFVSGQLQQALETQCGILVKCQELESNMELDLTRYVAWLPDHVRCAPTFPQQYIRPETTSRRKIYAAKRTRFAERVFELLNAHTGTLIGGESLEELVTVLKGVLSVASSQEHVRQLQIVHNSKPLNWVTDVFCCAWNAQMSKLLKQEVSTIDKSAWTVCDVQCDKQGIFSAKSILAQRYTKSTDLDNQLAALQGYLKGFTGSIENSSIARVRSSLQKWNFHVQQAQSNLTSLDSVRASLATTSTDKDWLIEQDQLVVRYRSQLDSLVESTAQQVSEDLLRWTVDAVVHAGDSVSQVVFGLKSVILIGQCTPVSRARYDEMLSGVYRHLVDKLPISVCLTPYQVASTGASYTLLGELRRTVNVLMCELGPDLSIWMNYNFKAIKDKIAQEFISVVSEKLDSIKQVELPHETADVGRTPKSQAEFDLRYLETLFGIRENTDVALEVERTRILFACLLG